MIVIDAKHDKIITIADSANVHIGDTLFVENEKGDILIDGEVRKVKHTMYVKTSNVPNYYLPYDNRGERIEVTVY